MYSLQSKNQIYRELCAEIFPVKPIVHYTEHPQYQELIDLLNVCNEVQALIVIYHPGHKRFQEELQYCNESLEDAKKRAISEGEIINNIIPIETHHGWTSREYTLLEQAKSFADALEIAVLVLENLRSNFVTQVCGPISTGGFGSVEKNLLAFHKTIQKLKNTEVVFDQMPFEPLFHTLHQQWVKDNGNSYMYDVLDKFYLPLFEMGHIKKFCFMHGYLSSHGAKWEHAQATRLGTQITYLPENFVTL